MILKKQNSISCFDHEFHVANTYIQYAIVALSRVISCRTYGEQFYFKLKAT